MEIKFKPKGVCSQAIRLELTDGVVHNVRFTGGCPGNAQGVARLTEGMEAKEVVARILARAEEEPSVIDGLDRLTAYYLPTTVKLVQSYQNFDGQPQTASVTAAKGEILTTLDVINAAFETLLDGLYQDDAMDVSADISVLKTMLAQEGLTGNDFPGLDARPGEKNS